jgi:hypothetical protein
MTGADDAPMTGADDGPTTGRRAPRPSAAPAGVGRCRG